jgi:hypothetical protein
MAVGNSPFSKNTIKQQVNVKKFKVQFPQFHQFKTVVRQKRQVVGEHDTLIFVVFATVLKKE